MSEGLPAEILSRIFVFDCQLSGRAQHITPPELPLSRVSRWWRHVALSTSELWSIIDIYTPKSLERARLYFDRSGSWPLSLQIDLHTLETRKGRLVELSQFRPFFQALEELLSSQWGRYRSISILTRFEVTLYAIVHSISAESAPLLETLELRTEPNESSSVEGKRLFPNGAPNLTKLHNHALDLWPPMSRLRTLCLRRTYSRPLLTPAVLLNILSEATELVNLSFHRFISSANWPDIIPSPSLHLGHLELLSIVGDGPATSNFLLSLSAPKLRSLWIEDLFISDIPRLFASPQVQNPDSPKFPLLQYLTLQRMYITHIAKFSFVFPTITTLHVAYIPIWNAHRLLNQTPGESPIKRGWPLLRTLVLRTRDDSTPEHAPASFWPSFIKERCEAGFPINLVLADANCTEALRSHLDTQEFGGVGLKVLSPETYHEPGWLMRENGDWF
ncbi:hypothetical protein AX16_004026 [Volvariella volvacea WC 439]|nr:hypothetical protein AX16_004026 [Volvariella volvacea WC 439]